MRGQQLPRTGIRRGMGWGALVAVLVAGALAGCPKRAVPPEPAKSGAADPAKLDHKAEKGTANPLTYVQPVAGVPAPDAVLNVASQLGLTSSQQAEIETLNIGFKRDLQPLLDDIRANMDVYQKERTAAKQKPGKAAPQLFDRAEKLKELTKKGGDLREKYWQKMAKVLSTEQQRKARDLWKDPDTHMMEPG